MNSDKIKSKSLENGEELEFYEKINDKHPLEEELSAETEETTHLEELTKFSMPEFTSILPINKDNQQKKHLKQEFNDTMDQIQQFKQELTDYISNGNNVEVRLNPPDHVMVYSDTFNGVFIKKINKISDEWVIKSANAWNEHNLVIEIKMR